MSRNIDTEVIIIGAGPAGASTSIFLTKAGIKHVIIEKEIFPRDKVCGDACSGKSVFVLRKANPEWLQEIFDNAQQYTPSHGVIIASPNGKQLAIPYSPSKVLGEKAPGFITPRLTLDNFLFSKLPSSYNTIYQKAIVKEIVRGNDGKMKVTFIYDGETYTVTAPIIVGADGDKSQVRKTFLNDHTSPKTYSVGVRGYYKGVTEFHERNFIELHFLPEMLPGYFWVFPLPNGMANVGVCMPSDRVRKKKINLREQMLDAINNNPNIKHRFANATLTGKIQGWGLPTCIKKRPISGDNFLLTGDAATLIDPFSGEGIGNALYSGLLAANAIKEALDTGNFDGAFLKQKYDDVLFRKMGDELKTSAMLQRMCKYPFLFNFGINKARKSATLQKTISSMLADMNLRDELRKPSFYAKVLFNK